MAKSKRFGELLSDAIHKIKEVTGQKIGDIQGDIGEAIGRTAGDSTVEYWRRGNTPSREDLELLTSELIDRGGLDRSSLVTLWESAGYFDGDIFYNQFFGSHFFDLHAPIEAIQSRLPDKSYTELIGRDEVIEEILNELGTSSETRCVAVDGISGIGKTALARVIAEKCIERQMLEDLVWIDMSELDPANANLKKWSGIQDVMLAQLIPSRAEDIEDYHKRGQLREIFRSRQTLLVIDNLEIATEDQNELLNRLNRLLDKSKAFLLSRHRFIGDAYTISLEGLVPTAAHDFLQQEAIHHNIESLKRIENRELEEIAQVTGGAPHAMKLLIGQLRLFPVSAILAQLRQTTPLNERSDHDGLAQFYRSIYIPSWDSLELPNQQILVALAVLAPGHSEDLETITRLSGFDSVTTTVESLQKPLRLSLIEVDESDTSSRTGYYLHALTQNFILSKIAEAVPYNSERHNSSDINLQNYFQQCVQRGVEYLSEKFQNPSTVTSPSVGHFALHLLHHAIEIAILWPSASQLLIKLAPQMEQANRVDSWQALLQNALEQSILQNDDQIEAELRWKLGRFYYLSQIDFDLAGSELEKSRQLYEQQDDRMGQVKALLELTHLDRLSHRLEDTIWRANKILEMLDEEDVERSSVYAILGDVALEQEVWSDAEEWYDKALQLAEERADLDIIAKILIRLGMAKRSQEAYAEAIESYQQAAALFQHLDKSAYHGIALINLGNVYIWQGCPNKALEQFELAESVLQISHMELDLAQLYTSRGIAHRHLGQWEEAENYLTLGIRRWKRMKRIRSLVNAVDEMGHLYGAQNMWPEAIVQFRQAQQYIRNAPKDIYCDDLGEIIKENLHEALLNLSKMNS